MFEVMREKQASSHEESNLGPLTVHKEIVRPGGYLVVVAVEQRWLKPRALGLIPRAASLSLIFRLTPSNLLFIGYFCLTNIIHRS